MLIDQAPRHWIGSKLPDHLSDELGQHWRLVSQQPVTSHWTLYDNADWALWQAGALFFRSGRDIEWRDSGHRLAFRAKRKQVRFWWDFPDSELQQALRPLLGVRALIEQAQVQRVERWVALCNGDHKVVARLLLQDLDLEQKSLGVSGSCGHIGLFPLRGYSDECEQITERLDALLPPKSWAREADERIDTNLLLQAGLQPAPPPPKVFDVEPGEQTEAAVRRLALCLLQRARDQQEGLMRDLDTEFLHQYRVALRKTRSLLTLMKGAFPEARQQGWKTHLSELARATNQVRDLDVFLLSESYYRQLLPEDFDKGLDQLFKDCRRQRQQALRRLRRFVQSPAYARKFDELTASLSETPELATELAAQPVKPVVDGQIVKRYRKICRRIARLDSGSPVEQLHQLRIAGKKLRYLMEFFAQLYPSKKIAKNIKATKKLQSLLGDFNDYSVQIAFLRDRLNPAAAAPDLDAAVNGLIAVLHQQQSALRADLIEALRDFCTNSRRRKLEQMCRDTESGL